MVTLQKWGRPNEQMSRGTSEGAPTKKNWSRPREQSHYARANNQERAGLTAATPLRGGRALGSRRHSDDQAIED